MKLSFLGAAREVTGSCFLVEVLNLRFLVDCGMAQGGRTAAARNREPFTFDPASIDFVLLTHAHIDHSGLLPKLTRAGFKGAIYATPATVDLLGVMLPDSAHIQESDAKRSAKRFRGEDALPPLYTLQDARECLQQVRGIEYDREFAPRVGVRARFRDAGHILGSAIIEVWVTEYGYPTKLVFSGDLGQPGRPILRDPTPIEDADILVIESTYGNRQHKDLSATEEEMIGIVEKTLFERGGNVIVPAFAVGRTQEVLYHLHRLTSEGRLRQPRVFVDSPMATEATRITREHLELFDEQAKRLAGWHARGENLPYLHFTESAEESMALNQIRSGAIIISASGMCDAGRIRHHLRHNLPRRECSILFPGFQAQGTLGRCLIEGAERVRIFGEDIPVRAAIHSVDGLSAHADQKALLDWARGFAHPPAQTFVVHGEESAALAFAELLQQQLGWQVTVPGYGHALAGLSGARVMKPAENLDERRRAIRESPTYRLAYEDIELLGQDELRPLRLQLELLKPERILHEQGIRSTVVVFGSARVSDAETAEARLGALEQAMLAIPEKARLKQELARVRRRVEQARHYERARRFASLISTRFQQQSRRDFVVVTGGGPGIMEAANRGAFEVGARSIGLNITLPHEQAPNPYMCPELAFRFHYFALRKMHFLMRAKGLVAFPGGYGTLDELFEVLTLIQTGKMQRIPVVLVGRAFWCRVVDFDLLLDEGYVSPSDIDLFTCVDEAEEIVSALERFYVNWAAGDAPK